MGTRSFERGGLHVLAGVATFVGLSTLAGMARAQAEPATIDTVRGPVAGSTRLIGLGGAFVAIADDTEGVAINPASVAVRLPYSWSSWDYGFGVDVAFGAILPKDESEDAMATEDVSENTAFFGSLAAILNYRHAGIGISAEAQHNAATREDQAQGIAPTDLTANFGMVHANLAYGFLSGQLLLGAGTRIIGMSFDRNGSGSGPLSTAGLGFETGVMIKPLVQQYRIAASFKSPVNAKIPGEPGEPESTLHVPWEAAVGFAYQFGKRPLNPPFVTAKDFARQTSPDGEPTEADIEKAERQLFERYQRLQRWYLLVSTELAMLEGGGDRVSIGQYWRESDDTTSARPVFSPRIGLESEVVPHILRLRVGSYYEPARIVGTKARVHGTGGFDVRLFRWSVFGLMEPFDYWQLSIAADAAQSYLNTSFSIGFWH